MAGQWYFASDRERVGPFSAAELKQLAALGTLRPTDTVWKEGVDKGVVAEKVKHLFSPPQTPEFPASANVVVANEDSPSLQSSRAVHEESSPLHSPQVANEDSPSLQSSDGLGASPSPTDAKLDPRLISMDGQGTSADEQPQGIIPDGLRLKEMPEQNDSAFLVSPLPTGQVEAEEGQRRETSPALTRTTGVPPKSSAITALKGPGAEKAVRQGRATGVRGAVIISQDGEMVRYRKKCSRCGYEDVCRSTMKITQGVTRENFFCPKCRKMGEVVIQGVT